MFVDFCFVLEKVGEILYLFEVVDCYVVGIGQYVGYYQDVVFGKDCFGFWCGWVVGFFDDDLGVDVCCVELVDLCFQGSWYEEFVGNCLEDFWFDNFVIWCVDQGFVFGKVLF